MNPVCSLREFGNSRGRPDSQSSTSLPKIHASSPALTCEEDLHDTVFLVLHGSRSLSSLPCVVMYLWDAVSTLGSVASKGPFHGYFSVFFFPFLTNCQKFSYGIRKETGTGICHKADTELCLRSQRYR